MKLADLNNLIKDIAIRQNVAHAEAEYYNDKEELTVEENTALKEARQTDELCDDIITTVNSLISLLELLNYT